MLERLSFDRNLSLGFQFTNMLERLSFDCNLSLWKVNLNHAVFDRVTLRVRLIALPRSLSIPARFSTLYIWQLHVYGYTYSNYAVLSYYVYDWHEKKNISFFLLCITCVNQEHIAQKSINSVIFAMYDKYDLRKFKELQAGYFFPKYSLNK